MNESPSAQRRPTAGSIVHFVTGNQNDPHHAALIVFAHSDQVVNLVAWNTGGAPCPYNSVNLDPKRQARYSWHWPEKVD